jgi:hypothetical protein
MPPVRFHFSTIRCGVLDRRASQTCQLERIAGCGGIAREYCPSSSAVARQSTILLPAVSCVAHRSPSARSASRPDPGFRCFSSTLRHFACAMIAHSRQGSAPAREIRRLSSRSGNSPVGDSMVRCSSRHPPQRRRYARPVIKLDWTCPMLANGRLSLDAVAGSGRQGRKNVGGLRS